MQDTEDRSNIKQHFISGDCQGLQSAKGISDVSLDSATETYLNKYI